MNKWRKALVTAPDGTLKKELMIRNCTNNYDGSQMQNLFISKTPIAGYYIHGASQVELL